MKLKWRRAFGRASHEMCIKVQGRTASFKTLSSKEISKSLNKCFRNQYLNWACHIPGTRTLPASLESRLSSSSWLMLGMWQFISSVSSGPCRKRAWFWKLRRWIWKMGSTMTASQSTSRSSVVSTRSSFSPILSRSLQEASSVTSSTSGSSSPLPVVY